MKNKKNIPYLELESQGITDKKVLKTIRHLPRELFIAPELRESAYINAPLPIDCDQTISQPFMVAYMSEKLELKKTDKVLEIGTGSGFQAAVLAQLAHEVYTVELLQCAKLVIVFKIPKPLNSKGLDKNQTIV